MSQIPENSERWEPPFIPYEAPADQRPWKAQPSPVLQPAGPHYPPGYVPWRAVDIIAIIALIVPVFYFVELGLGLILDAIIVGFGLDRNALLNSPYITTLALAVQWIIVYGVTLAFFRMRGYTFEWQTLGFRKPPSIPKAIGLAVGLLIVADVAINIYSSYITPQQQQVTSEFSMSTIGFILAIIEVVILVPIIEETFFRGIIHQGMERSLGFFWGAIASATIFGLAHVVGNQATLSIFVPIFLLGFAFAWLMHHTHSLLPSVIAHAIFNLVAVISQYFFIPPS